MGGNSWSVQLAMGAVAGEVLVTGGALGAPGTWLGWATGPTDPRSVAQSHRADSHGLRDHSCAIIGE